MSEQKRVLLIATVQSHIGQFHKPLMRMLKEQGWEIHVAARNNLGEKDTLQLDYPDKVFDIPFQRSPFDRRNLLAYWQLKAVLHENRYDVIHCNTPVGGILGRLAAGKYRKARAGEKNPTQVFYTAHGFHFYKGSPRSGWLLYYPIEKFFAHRTDLLITINEEDYALAKSKLSCPVAHIHGVGADTQRYYPLSEEEQTILKQKLGLTGHLLLTAGELLPNKNQRTAILAMKEVLKDFPDARLLIAGNGPERNNLETLVQQENLADHVTFLGYTRSLPQYMQICNLEITCSHREGMPMNVIEAMLCGKPVAASNIRGHRELIKEGVNGFLAGADDSEAFGSGICRLLSAPSQDPETIRRSVAPFTDTAVNEELKRIYSAI